MPDTTSAGDVIPPDSHRIEVRVGELRRLFNAIDPSPFHERDLDPRAEEFIVGWAKDGPAHVPLALVVHLDRAAGRSDEATSLRDAIHQFFSARATGSRRQLRELFRRGRLSLLIALAFLSVAVIVGNRIGAAFAGSRFAEILQEGFLIGGWVAMWRPIEVFLYDWWPIRAEMKLFERLSRMPVRIEYANAESVDAWRSDWPAVPAAEATLRHPSNTERDGTSRRHDHTPAEERTIREAALDQTVEASFPASDPPSSNPNPDDHDAVRPAPGQEKRRPA
jgi:hypothetical protein